MRNWQQRTDELLARFRLSDLDDRDGRLLSGGQMRRASLAIGIALNPGVLLLDEPTASLDHTSKQKVRDLIEQLKLEGTTMLGIFHDLEFMEGLCDREYNMQKGMMA